MSDTPLTTDVAVIGAGPVGLFAVFECGMLKLRCHVIDTLEMIGGQCSALYPEKPIYDIPGYPRIVAQELVDRLVEQAAPFAPVYHLGQQVTGLARLDSERGDAACWRVTTSAGAVIDATAVVIAAGCGAFGPNRPPLPGLEDYEATSVHYLVQRRESFRGRRIVIAGGGDSAVDWANSLAELAEKVYVVHRRAKFRAAPESVERLHRLAAAGKVELVIPYQLAALEGDGRRLSGVVVADLEGHRRLLPADSLLPFFGLSMNLGPIAGWGLELEHHHVTVNPATGETNHAGIFAIGDIAHYHGKLKLILTGFSEAAIVAHAIRPLVYPDEALHWEYSTTKGVPAAG
ncbi:MAG TPA: NAD(P)/FAD-dependent oxidoreductase [Kiloniellaceae bacterium]